MRRLALTLALAALSGCQCGGGKADGGLGGGAATGGGSGGGTATGGGAAMGGGSGGGSSVGGGTATGGGTGGGGGPSTLTGHLVTWYWELPNQVAVPDPDPSSQISILVPLSDGGYDTRPVTNTGDGGFSAANLPAGEVWVRVYSSYSTYILTDQRDLDLDTVAVLGRPGTDLASVGDPLTLSITGLASTDSPELLIVSPGTGFYGDAVLDNDPSSAVTSLSDEPASYVFTTGDYPDGTATDTSWVLQWADTDGGHPDGGGSYSAFGMLRSATLTGLSLDVDGGTVTAALASGTLDSFAYTIKGAAWANHVTEVSAHPSAPFVFVVVDESPWASGLPNAYAAYLGDMSSAALDLPAGDFSWATRYLDPFPSTWKRVMGLSLEVTQTAQLPGTNTGQAFGVMSDYRELSSPATFTPRISPPDTIVIDGLLANNPGTLSSLTPTLAWGGPTVGTAQEYEVTVSHLTASGTDTIHTYEHTLHTVDTRLKIPPGVLQSGETYVFIVQASTSADVNVAQRPFFSPIDYASAQALTGMWKAP